jgi:anti-sigma regulatory factor (Ser/Thr protein kinase)
MDTQPISRDTESTKDRVNEEVVIPLTFTAVDGLAFAARKGKLGAWSKHYVVREIGPFLELNQLSIDGILPPLENVLTHDISKTGEFCSALHDNRRYWICPSSKQIGFFRTTKSEEDISNSYQFGMAAKNAAAIAGFPKQVASQLVAAAVEMVDNIYLHSTLSRTGLAAFHAEPGHFEFAVLDRGIGVLRSLQESSQYAGLSDHGDALQLALTDGCSRFGPNSNHGHGFRPLFIGLSNLNGTLRFRSGDHALTIDGRNPQSIPWTKIAKPKISGFLASISCRTHRGR